VPVGLFLSAGLDSSSVALTLAQAQRTDDVTAWTLTSRGIDPAIDEAPTAAALARALMMRHRTIELDRRDLANVLHDTGAAFDEPQGFTALLTASRIAQGARESGLKVVMAGDGGDEALAGYTWHTSTPHPLSLDPACEPPSASLAARSYTHRYLCRVFPGFAPIQSRSLLSALEPEYDEELFAAWLAPEDRPSLPHPRRSQRLDIMGFCAGSILPKIDRAAMHVGLELRAPFLDRRLLDWALARPVDPRETQPSTSKPMLRALLSRGARAGLVPPALLQRPKQGFSPRLGAERPIETLAGSFLPESRLVRDGVIRRDFAAFLPADTEARQVRLFTLCMLAAWYEPRCGA
jgi:asparagine synthase (glutamine-hydrolysing)